ncbi:Cytochrome P450 4g15 [Gryllus bimaculatus]|nr:Cytochrome P450 4g15 [Gryllus bimaculatus]
MDTWTLFALVLLVLGAIQYYVYFWSRPARETSRFLPGPRSWPIFGAALSIGRNPVGDPVFMEPLLKSTVNIKKSMNYEFLQPWLSTGLLTSSDAAMGVQMNVQNNQNCEYIATLHNPWYFPEFIFNLSPKGRKQKDLIKALHSMSYKVIEQRKKDLCNGKKIDNSGTVNHNDVGQKKRLAFLDMLLQYNEDGGNLTLEDIREEVDTFMFEGHDTTSSGLSFCLWSLAEHPDCQEKAYEELFEIFGDSDRETTTEDLGKMKYLECVIKESLRLYPSVPLFLRELNEDKELISLLGQLWSVPCHHATQNPQYFPNPEKFDPERFTQKM